MSRKKKIKAGTKIIIHTSCNYAGCDERHPMTLDEDMTEDEINSLANDIALDTVQPEGYFTVVGEGEDDE